MPSIDQTEQIIIAWFPFFYHIFAPYVHRSFPTFMNFVASVLLVCARRNIPETWRHFSMLQHFGFKGAHMSCKNVLRNINHTYRVSTAAWPQKMHGVCTKVPTLSKVKICYNVHPFLRCRTNRGHACVQCFGVLHYIVPTSIPET